MGATVEMSLYVWLLITFKRLYCSLKRELGCHKRQPFVFLHFKHTINVRRIMYEWRKILMYYLFHSTDHETAKNTKNTKRPSFEASAYMQQKGFPITKVLKLPQNGYLPILEQ